MAKKEKNATYIAMWCNQGLEALINVTKLEQENIIATLKGEALPHRNPIHYMILRATHNSQRHYEIYSFTSSIPEEDILQAFKESPQVIVNSIREIGVKMYSDRKTQKDVIT